MKLLHVVRYIIAFVSIAAIPATIWFGVKHEPIWASVTGATGTFLIWQMVRRYTSPTEFAITILLGLATAFSTEYNTQGAPFLLGSAIMFGVAAFLGRLVFIKQLAYSNWYFSELVLTILGTISMLLSVWLQQTHWSVWAANSIFLVLGLMQSLFIISNAKFVRSAALKGYDGQINTTAPDFELTDQNNQTIKLSDFRNKQHVLLIFVRGDWCPYCHITLRTYQRNKHRFANKNIMIMAIGPDPQGVNRQMVENLGLEYKVLSDEKFTIVKKYGIQIPDYKISGVPQYDEGMPLPASFLIDKQGIIRYTSRPERPGEFLSPETIFPIIENLH